MAAYLLNKEVEKIRLQVLLESKSTLFEVINNFILYDRVCIVSALTGVGCITQYSLRWKKSRKGMSKKESEGCVYKVSGQGSSQQSAVRSTQIHQFAMWFCFRAICACHQVFLSSRPLQTFYERQSQPEPHGPHFFPRIKSGMHFSLS